VHALRLSSFITPARGFLRLHSTGCAVTQIRGIVNDTGSSLLKRDARYESRARRLLRADGTRGNIAGERHPPSLPFASPSLSLSLSLFPASYRGARGRSGAVPRPVISGGLTRITMYNHGCRERLRPIINTAMLAGRINNANNTLRPAINPLPLLSHCLRSKRTRPRYTGR